MDKCAFEKSDANNILENILANTVNDYFTPNIKGEVIFDMLMTDLVADIVQIYVKNGSEEDFIKLLTKEMSLVKSVVEESEGLKGKKVDYVLADRDTIYLVELKTTSGSFDEKQRDFYQKFLDKDNPWNIMLQTLVDILNKTCSLKGERENITYNNLKVNLNNRLATYRNKKIYLNEGSYTEKVKEYLKVNKCASSWKYLYTMGNILDFFKVDSGDANLTRSNVKLVYITPEGIGLEDIEKKENDINFKNMIDEKERSITFNKIIGDKNKICEKLADEKKPIFKFFCAIVSQCIV